MTKFNRSSSTHPSEFFFQKLAETKSSFKLKRLACAKANSRTFASLDQRYRQYGLPKLSRNKLLCTEDLNVSSDNIQECKFYFKRRLESHLSTGHTFCLVPDEVDLNEFHSHCVNNKADGSILTHILTNKDVFDKHCRLSSISNVRLVDERFCFTNHAMHDLSDFMDYYSVKNDVFSNYCDGFVNYRNLTLEIFNKRMIINLCKGRNAFDTHFNRFMNRYNNTDFAFYSNCKHYTFINLNIPDNEPYLVSCVLSHTPDVEKNMAAFLCLRSKELKDTIDTNRGFRDIYAHNQCVYINESGTYRYRDVFRYKTNETYYDYYDGNLSLNLENNSNVTTLYDLSSNTDYDFYDLLDIFDIQSDRTSTSMSNKERNTIIIVCSISGFIFLSFIFHRLFLAACSKKDKHKVLELAQNSSELTILQNPEQDEQSNEEEHNAQERTQEEIVV